MIYISNKDDLKIVEVLHLGNDLSSDLITVKNDNNNVYISMRNGKLIRFDVKSRIIKEIKISEYSSWDHIINKNKIYVATVDGEIIEIDTDSILITNKTKICKKNIYSLIYDKNIIYTVSQDKTLKAINTSNFEIINTTKNAVNGMCRIVGIINNVLIIADRGLSFWNKETLELLNKFNFPTGHFNKGITLNNNILFGSDFSGVYKYIID